MDTATDHTDAILGHHRTWDGTLWFRVRWASGDVTDEPLSNLVDGDAGDSNARINVHLLAYWVTHPEARPRPTWKQRTQAMSHAPASEPAPDPVAVLRPFCAYQSSQGPCHAVATHGRSGPTRNNAFRAGYCDAHVCPDCKLRKMANDCNVCSACRNARLLRMGIHVGSYRRRLPEDTEANDAGSAKKRARIVY